MTTSSPKVIIPERPRCDCGKRVLNHHWLCDFCYSKKKIEEAKKFNKKRIGGFNPPKWMTNERIHQTR